MNPSTVPSHTRPPMPSPHQPGSTPWAAELADSAACSLSPEPQARWLRVEDGQLWVTRRDSHGQRDDDIWLKAGDTLALPAGSAWVVEAWPRARLSLLQQAPAALSASPSSAHAAAAAPAWWRPAAWVLRSSLLHA